VADELSAAQKAIGDFAPKLVELTDEVLFGDRPVAAVVPADVATAGAAAVEALEEAEDIRAARAALAGCAPRVPLSEVLAEYADDLAAYPNVDAR
jgi:4-carboxymuconolactone decarboxylase